MEQKTKDMTASALLRKAASGYEGAPGRVTENLVELMGGSRNTLSFVCFEELANKIDAELAQARGEALLQGAMLWAKANGWPDFREGEDFGAWLDRCAIPRPRYEDGEVVAVGEYEDIGGYCVRDDGEFFITNPNRTIDFAPGERVERPAPEALGADGKPIVAGETVYDIYRGDPIVVKGISRDSDGNPVVWGESNEIAMPHLLTHTPPDTQERIDEDAVKSSSVTYWGCSGICCDECPAKIDGKVPDERYGTSGCREAMVLDLLRRQRELDKRAGGEQR